MSAPHPQLPRTLEQVRSDFPALEQSVHGHPLAYLDNAASTLKPLCVIEAITNHYRHNPANIHRGVHTLSDRATQAYEQARESIRAHLHAASEREIIFTSGTTDSINMAASCLADRFSPGDELMITGLEHHSNIVPWQMLCARTGAVLRPVPVRDDGELDMHALRNMLCDRTRLIAFTAVSNAIGTITPVQEIVELAHAAGALALVDAAQAIATQPIDVQVWGCDLLAFSGHKVFGPTGIGVLYGREALLERLPPYRGGGDMIRSVTFEKTTYNTPPALFEAGTPNIAGAIGLGRAIDYVNEIGFDTIQHHEQTLLKAALEALASVPGVRILGSPSQQAAIVSFVMDGIHPHDAGTILDRQGVAIRAGHHCAQPLMAHFGVSASIRASFSIYNTTADLAPLVEGLQHARSLFQ